MNTADERVLHLATEELKTQVLSYNMEDNLLRRILNYTKNCPNAHMLFQHISSGTVKSIFNMMMEEDQMKMDVKNIQSRETENLLSQPYFQGDVDNSCKFKIKTPPRRK